MLRFIIGVAMAGWLASGCFLVGPAERAVVTRFGAMTGAPLASGLHYHWPFPFGRADRLAVGQIRRVEIGFRSAADSTAALLLPAPQDEGTVRPGAAAVHGSPTESWMLTGDENILDLQCVVSYQVNDRPEDVLRVLYAVRDPDGLVRAAARWALQEAVGSQAIDSLLTVGRGTVERRVREALLQPALDACGSGLRVVDVRLTSVHAPTPVHWAFRDVAGAAEDAAQYVHAANEYTERTVREAAADSARAVSLALGQAVDRVQQATGEASSFESQSVEYRRAPGLTRTRLHLEQLERVLPGLRLYVDLSGPRGEGPDIWLRRGAGPDAPPFVAPTAPGSNDRERTRPGEEGK
jgi:membrane protease subunit HflK